MTKDDYVIILGDFGILKKLEARLNLKNGCLDIIMITKQLMTKKFYYMIKL